MNRRDFDEIYSAYFKDVFFYLMSICCNKALAEELTQESFIKAMKSIGKFRGECDVRVWLCQIAKNEYFMYCRKNGRVALCDTETFGDNADNSAGRVRFEEKLEDNETALDIHKILHTLNEPYKEVFWLRTFGELSFKQIADLFGHTESWARVTYHRARLKIIEELEENKNEQN